MIGASEGSATLSMRGVIDGLAPALAAGFAVQQLLELADPVLGLIPASLKKPLLSLIALAAGLALAIGAHLHVLAPLGVHTNAVWDDIVTGVFVSGGTQGFNAVMKFLGYAKEQKKAQADHQRAQAAAAGGTSTGLAPLHRV